MQYNRTVTLKNGKPCRLFGGKAENAADVLAVFTATHAQTDYLLTYPEENTMTVADEAEFLAKSAASDTDIEICAEVDGKIVGTAGINALSSREKLRHRAEFGVAVDCAFWGMGIGRVLTLACIECAKQAGYAQLELDVVAENTAALALYKSVGFVEYGRNPRGFRSRTAGWQELVLMRMELQ